MGQSLRFLDSFISIPERHIELLCRISAIGF